MNPMNPDRDFTHYEPETTPLDKDTSLDSKIDGILDRFWSRTPIGEVGACRERTVQHILDIINQERLKELDSMNGYLNEINEEHLCYGDITIIGEQIADHINELTQQSNGGKPVMTNSQTKDNNKGEQVMIRHRADINNNL
jgi:hypothetical protein